MSMRPGIEQFDEVASLCCADGRMVYLGIFPDGTYRIVRENHCLCIWDPDDSANAMRVFLALCRCRSSKDLNKFHREWQRQLRAGAFINN
jgi:hypothetical protein